MFKFKKSCIISFITIFFLHFFCFSLTNGSAEGKIVFTSDRTGNFEIWIMADDGSDQTQLTDNPANDQMPAFSPDGSKISFSSNREGEEALYIMNSDGTNINKIAKITGCSRYWSDWSPDGNKIYFGVPFYGERGLYWINSDGSGSPVKIVSGDVHSPSVSPDGTEIVYSKRMPTYTEIVKANVDGSNEKQLTTGGGNIYPSWSPDGAKIVYWDSNNASLTKMNTDGSSKLLIITEHSDPSPVWSPDSKKIAYMSNVSGNYDVYIVNDDGTGKTQLTTSNASDIYPDWINVSTKSEAIVYINPDTLNLKSKGNWITCYMELPEDYDINDIDTSSVILSFNEAVIMAETSPVEIGDYDNDGILDLMVKFNRESVHSSISEPGEIEITVTAESYDGICFEGVDTVLVIDKGK